MGIPPIAAFNASGRSLAVCQECGNPPDEIATTRKKATKKQRAAGKKYSDTVYRVLKCKNGHVIAEWK